MITYKKTINGNSNSNLITLTIEFFYNDKKLCTYFGIFLNGETPVLKESIRTFFSDSWAVCSATIISTDGRLSHKFNFYKKNNTLGNKHFLKTIELESNINEKNQTIEE